MKLTDSKQPGWQKLLFFLSLGLAYFLFINLTGDASWLLSKEEKMQRRAYTIAQQYINQTYAPPSPATFPGIDEVIITAHGGDVFQIEGWVVEPDFNGKPQRFDYDLTIAKANNIWSSPKLRFKGILHGQDELEGGPVEP